MNKEIDMQRIPKHIAIILDGNGRWAKERMLPRFLGHRQGALNIIKIAKSCQKLGIESLTCFCFSTENWKRPQEEVDYLMKTPIKYYKRYKEKIFNSNYKIQILGRKTNISSELKEIFDNIETKTKNNTGLVLNLCVDYGSYEEITSAVKKISMMVKNNEFQIDDINENLIENNLYTKGLPKLDLLIRTSGEQRISNFMLWQLAYAELYFTNVFWPDFDENELKEAIISYQSRNRRFGGLKENK